MSGLWASGDVVSMARMNQKTLFMGTSQPATTYAGQIWYNTTTDCMEVRNAGNTAWYFMNQTLTQITAPVTAAYNATTTLMTFTLGANALQIGQTFIVEGWCNQISAASAAAFTVRLWWSSASYILLSTGAITPTVSLTGDMAHFRFIVTVISTTSVEAQGIIEWNPAAAQTIPLRSYVLNASATGTTVPNTAVIGSLPITSSALAVDCIISNVAANSLQLRAGYIRIQ